MNASTFGAYGDKLLRGSWMHKPGSKGTGIRVFGGTKWNRRHVWIQSNAVHYGPQERKAERAVLLRDVTAVTRVSEREVVDEKGPAAFAKFGWKLSAGEKSITFVAESLQDREDWVLGLTAFLARTQGFELDDDEETAYRLAQQESLPAFSRRAESVMSSTTANFNSEAIDELVEDEEGMRTAMEKKFRKWFVDVEQQMLDEYVQAVTREQKAASEVRARSVSQLRERSTSLIRPAQSSATSPASSPPRQEPSSEAQIAHSSSSVATAIKEAEEAQHALLYDETRERSAVVDERDSAHSSLLSSFRDATAVLVALLQQRKAEKEEQLRRSHDNERHKFCVQEDSLRTDVVQAYRDATQKLEEAHWQGKHAAAAAAAARIAESERKREQQHHAEHAAVIKEEGDARQTIQKIATSTRQKQLAQFQEGLAGIRERALRLLQDQAKMIAAQHAAQLAALFEGESSLRQALLDDEDQARQAGLSAEADGGRRTAKEKEAQRLALERAEHERQCIAAQAELMGQEGAQRSTLEKAQWDLRHSAAEEAQRSYQSVLDHQETMRIKALERIARNTEDQRRFLESESHNRSAVASEEGTNWLQHIVKAAHESRRAATDAHAKRIKLAESQRVAFVLEESTLRQAIANQEQYGANEAKVAFEERHKQIRAKEHARALLVAALKYCSDTEEAERLPIVQSEGLDRQQLLRIVTTAREAFLGGYRIASEFLESLQTHQIMFDCGLQDAHEKTHKRIGQCIDRLIDDETEGRTAVTQESMRDEAVLHVERDRVNRARELEAARKANDEAAIRRQQQLQMISFVEEAELIERNSLMESEVEDRSLLRNNATTEGDAVAKAALSRRNDEAQVVHADHVPEAQVQPQQQHDVASQEPVALRSGSAQATSNSPSSHGKPVQASSSASQDASRRSSMRRERAATLVQREQQAHAAAEAAWNAEQAALLQYVTRGSWMHKPGSKKATTSMFSFGGTKWNRRFVWIRNDQLLYGEKPDKPEKPISFRSLRKVAVVPAFEAEREGCPKHLTQFVWRVSSTEKSIIFACESEKDRNSWVRFLEAVTGQIDKESVVTSLKSAAISGVYATSEGEDSEEYLSDPFDGERGDDPLDDDVFLHNDGLGLDGAHRSVSQQQHDSESAGQHDNDGADELTAPQTFDEWCQLLFSEEATEREALQSVESRHRTREVTNFKANMPKAATKSSSGGATSTGQQPSTVGVSESTPASQRSLQSDRQSSSAVGANAGRSDARQDTSAESVAPPASAAPKDDAERRRAEAAAVRAAAEAEERRKVVTRGAWMLKPRSQSTTSSSLLRTLSSIGGNKWNKRYVWVEENRICYGEKPGKPEKQVALRAIQSVYPVSPETMRAEGAPKNAWTLGFKLTADDRSILWAAPDANTRRAFIDFLTPMAKRQPSGMAPTASQQQYRGSINNDTAVNDDDFDDPFGNDYDDEYDDDLRSTNTGSASAVAGAAGDHGAAKATEVSGGPTVRAASRKRPNPKQGPTKYVHDIVVPLMSVPMLLQRVDELVALRREEGLVGVAVVNRDGLCIRASGAADPFISGKMLRLMILSQTLYSGARNRRSSSMVTGDDVGAKRSPRLQSKHALATSTAAVGNSSIPAASADPQRATPRSIEIEIEGQGGHTRLVSCGSVGSNMQLLFVALHQTK